MSKAFVNPASIANPDGPYTHVVKAGDFVFLSGQGPLDLQTGEAIEGSFEEQARLVFQNIQLALQSVGATLKDVVKVNAHLNDLNDFERYNEIYAEYFEPPYPARITVGSRLGKIKLEIDVIAMLKDED